MSHAGHSGMPQAAGGHAPPSLDRAQIVLPREGWAARLPLLSGALGLALLAVSFLAGRGQGPQLYHSYLLNWLFFATLGVGGLFFVLLQHVTRAGWSVVVRRLAEHVAATLPVLALLFVPLAFGLHDVYPWAAHGHGAHDAMQASKAAWLSPGPFLLRAAIYLLAWSGLAIWFWRQSSRQDQMGALQITRRMQAVSAPALVVFALTLTFAAFDWIMSLAPRWYSTVFGGYVFGGLAMAIFALLILMALLLQRFGLLEGVVTSEHFHDLGKLLLAFVVFWAYIGFSQFMLMWYGNMPEETNWFAHRLNPGWKPLTVFLVIGHFIAPFFFLLLRDVKRHRATLWAAALWALLVHWVDLYWLVMPGLHPDRPRLHWLGLLIFVGLACIFVATVAWAMRLRALVPVNDPRLAESLAFENV
jgi:hypothetical protein